jgi:transposase-like protein
MTLNITNPIYTDKEKAREHLEGLRWPNGAVCPRCGMCEGIAKLQGKAHRPGLYYCKECKRQFTVTVGTLYERSHIPLHKWVLVMHLLCASKKGMSGHQLHRMLGVSYKTAWFMAHRLRAAMAGADNPEGGLGGEGKTVEADETYIGKKEREPSPQRKGRPYTKGGRSGPSGKRTVVALVERGGRARAFHVDKADAETVANLLRTNASRDSKLRTDESNLYVKVGAEFAEHRTVNHSAKEYVNLDDRSIHSNTVENFFSVFKRGMKGIYQHCGEQHLHRYLSEFEFRYNTRVRLGIGDFERGWC